MASAPRGSAAPTEAERSLIPLRAFLRPPVIVEFLFGLSPLAGIFWWGWDSYLVVMLHLLAMALAACWLALRIIALSDDALRYLSSTRENEPVGAARAIYVGFVVGAFGLPLLLFVAIVSENMGGAWHTAVKSPADFWRVVVVSSGLWIPLAAVAAWEALGFLGDVVLPRIPALRDLRPAPRPMAPEYATLSRELQDFLYARAWAVLRMVLTVVGIGFGLILAQLFGVIALVVVLIVTGTAVGVVLEACAVVDAERAAARG